MDRDQQHPSRLAPQADAAYPYACRAGFQTPAPSTDNSFELAPDSCRAEQALSATEVDPLLNVTNRSPARRNAHPVSYVRVQRKAHEPAGDMLDGGIQILVCRAIEDEPQHLSQTGERL